MSSPNHYGMNREKGSRYNHDHNSTRTRIDKTESRGGITVREVCHFLVRRDLVRCGFGSGRGVLNFFPIDSHLVPWWNRVVAVRELRGERCRGDRVMEGEGSASGRRWLRSGGQEFQHKSLEDVKGKWMVDTEGKMYVQSVEIFEEENEEQQDIQEEAAWRNRWKCLPGEDSEDNEVERGCAGGRSRGGMRGRGRRGRGRRGRGGSKRRDVAEGRSRRGRQCSPVQVLEDEPAADEDSRRTRQTISDRI